MEAKWRQDLNFTKTDKIELRTAATAFMDDTTWIASFKTNMQRILDARSMEKNLC